MRLEHDLVVLGGVRLGEVDTCRGVRLEVAVVRELLDRAVQRPVRVFARRRLAPPDEFARYTRGEAA